MRGTAAGPTSSSPPSGLRRSSVLALLRVAGAERVPVGRGVFRAAMEVELVNDGPVTLMIETPRVEGGA